MHRLKSRFRGPVHIATSFWGQGSYILPVVCNNADYREFKFSSWMGHNNIIDFNHNQPFISNQWRRLFVNEKLSNCPPPPINNQPQFLLTWFLWNFATSAMCHFRRLLSNLSNEVYIHLYYKSIFIYWNGAAYGTGLPIFEWNVTDDCVICLCHFSSFIEPFL